VEIHSPSKFDVYLELIVVLGIGCQPYCISP
jgi:hypothetical protein